MADFYEGKDGFFDYSDFDENDDFLQDEKIDRVLDEIAEIKKTIAARPDAALTPPRRSYEQADRLREEVRISKTSQRLAGEIDRINDRIDELTDEQASHFAKSDEQITSALRRIISLSESIMLESKDNDRRLSDELASLKRQLIKISSMGDISATLSSILSSVKKSEDVVIGLNGAIETLSDNEAAAKKDSSDKGFNAELARQFYELKSMIGSPSPLAARRNDEILTLYNMLVKARYDLRSESVSVGDKYASVDALVKKLSETGEYDVQPVVDGVNEIIDELGSLPLDGDTFDSLLEQSRIGGLFAIQPSRSDAVGQYISNVSRLIKDGIPDNMDDLSDIIALKNGVQGGRNEYENERIYSSVLSINIAIMSESDGAKQRALRAQLKTQIKKLTSLEVRDLVTYPPVAVSKQYRQHKLGEGESFFDKLNEIKNYILDANLAQSGGMVSPTAESGLAAELTNLKNELYNLGNIDDISRSVLELKADLALVLDKLEEHKPSVEVSDDGGVIATLPSLTEIVAQLDRLFDDVKNVISDSENNVMSSVDVIAEALVKLSQEENEKASAAKEDRLKLLDDVAFIRAAVEKGAPVVEPQDNVQEAAVSSSKNADAELSTRLDAIERNQQAILEALSTLSTTKRESDEFARLDERLTRIEEKLDNDALVSEIRTLSDRLFAISMANVAGDDGAAEYESYNNLILNEIYAIEEDIEELVGKLGNKKNDDAAIITELAKIKDELKKRPQEQKKPTQPVKKEAKKTVSVDDLLSRIGDTDIVIGND